MFVEIAIYHAHKTAITMAGQVGVMNLGALIVLCAQLKLCMKLGLGTMEESVVFMESMLPLHQEWMAKHGNKDVQPVPHGEKSMERINLQR